jgi:hypothetical protein
VQKITMIFKILSCLYAKTYFFTLIYEISTSERDLHKCIIVVNLDNLWYIKTKYLKQHNTNFYNILKENTIKCNLIVILCIVYMFFSSLGPRVHVRYSRQFPTVIGKLATFQSLYHKTLEDNLWYIKTKYLKQHNTNFYNILKENTIKCNLIVMDLIQINNLKDNNHQILLKMVLNTKPPQCSTQ